MRKLFTALAVLFLPMQLFAQLSITGIVTDAASNSPLVGANVLVMNTTTGASTNSEGAFTISNLVPGVYNVKFSFLGYEPVVRRVDLKSSSVLNIELAKKAVRAEEVLVTATRANEKTGTTYSNLTKEEVEARNFGQDLPFLLDQTPSLVTHSDAGAGIGYTGLRIRGSDMTRINLTVNGIPINDSESQGVFFVNMPDLASSIQDIQIQRGVGTSTNGAAAFGASINVRTLELNKQAYARTQNSFGSFNSWRNNVQFGTGLLDSKWAFDGRLSRIKSDGYIDRAASNLKSYYFTGGYYGASNMLKLVIFGGDEETYQAWDGVHQDSLKTNRTFNQNGTDGGRRKNPYDNEIDNYKQVHYQLHGAQELGSSWTLNGALHYTYGKGYFEQFKVNQRFSNYGLTPIVIGGQTINRTDLIRRRWLDNDFYGFTYSANYHGGEKLTGIIGGAWNRYDGEHFGEVIWARSASQSEIRHRYYEGQGIKTDFNVFAKANYLLTSNLNLFGDLQYRTINYELKGQDSKRNNVAQVNDFNFFNPKAGITYTITPTQSLYASFAIGNREPVRRDFTESSATTRPKNETLRNVEAGYRLFKSPVTLFGHEALVNAEANYYFMDYKDQLILTGQINDVGGYTRTNVPDSYRTGVELSGNIGFSNFLTASSNLSLSRNKIKTFNEFIDNFDTGKQIVNTYTDTDIAFSPSVVSGSQIEVMPIKNLRTAVLYKVVGKQYLDNTSNENRKINGYEVLDFRLRYSVFPKCIKELEFGLLVNNVLNQKYESNGYTFSFISGGRQTPSNFYYPQATRNYLLSLNLNF